jgi:hypothetical protein
MDPLIIGLVAIVVGGLVAFFGLRLFFVLLPLYAFVFGFVAGADLLQAVFGEGFLATVTSWVAGLAVGVLFALLSFFWYYAAVLLVGAAVGWTLGAGFAAWLGFDPGLITFLAGLAVAIVFGLAMLIANAPAALVIIATAIGGAAYAVAGAWTLLGQIGTEELSDGGAVSAILGQPVAIVAWLGVTVAAVLFQYLSARTTAVEIERERYRYA